MSSTSLLLTILLSIIALVIIYKWLKPYTLKYDTTLFLTGGLGSGKTLTAVKTSIVLLRKLRFKVKVKNTIIKTMNWLNRKNSKYKQKDLLPKPQLYSNIPIHFKTHFYTSRKNREWNKKAKVEHILLFERIPEYSVLLIDELPQLLSQYEWNLPIVQQNFTEFVTLYRHYIGGNLIVTAQSTSEIIAPLRRKANQATWCYNFKKHLLPFKWYTMQCCDIMLSDDVSTTTTTQIGENTKKMYCLFPPKGTYDTRCYSERYKNIPNTKNQEFKHVKTNDILRLKQYISPCDNNTTNEQRLKMLNQALSKKPRINYNE